MTITELPSPPTISFPDGPPDPADYLHMDNPDAFTRALRAYEAELAACARAGRNGPVPAAYPAPLPIVVVYALVPWTSSRYRVVLEINQHPVLERCRADSLGGESWARAHSDEAYLIGAILGESVQRTIELLDNRRSDGHVLGGKRDRIDGPTGQALITIDLGSLPPAPE